MSTNVEEELGHEWREPALLIIGKLVNQHLPRGERKVLRLLSSYWRNAYDSHVASTQFLLRFPGEISLNALFASPVSKLQCLTSLDIVQPFSPEVMAKWEASMLQLCNGKISNSITYLPKLRHLHLESVRLCSDERLEIMLGLRHLVSLRLRQVHLPEKAIITIEHLTNLETLELSSIMVFVEPEPFPNPPISEYNVGPTPSIRDDELCDVHLNILRPLVGLTSLDLSCNSIGNQGLRELSHLTKLLSLNLEGLRVTDVGMRHLSSLVNLRHLSVCSVGRIFREQYGWLLNFPELVALQINGTKATDGLSTALSQLTKLQHLDLGGTKVGSKTLESLGCLQNLLTLNLAGVDVSKGELAVLQQMESLKTVKLRAGDSGYVDDTKCPHINFIHVQGSGNLRLDSIDNVISEILDENGVFE